VATILLLLSGGPVAAQIRALPVPDTTAGNYFGAAVAFDGQRALVGASGEDGCGPNSGAVYVYERTETGAFVVVARLAPGQCEPGRHFGRAVALSGHRALVAAGGEVVDHRRPNTAHLFERSADGQWREVVTFTGQDDRAEGVFALSVALEGDRALITTSGDPAGRQRSGVAYVYELDASGRWVRTARLTPSRGVAYGIFGTMGVLDGDRLVVTASPYDTRGSGTVYVFGRGADGLWRETAHIGDIAAPTVHAALDGPLLLVGHTRGGPDRSGEAVLYVRSQSGHWRRQSTLVADVPYRDGAFGSLVALDRSGGSPRALIVGYTEQLGRDTGIDRVVHVFLYDAERGWVQRQVIDFGDWAFGAAIALAGRSALVGRTSDHRPGAVFAVELFD
jgi:hypothetical protein